MFKALWQQLAIASNWPVLAAVAVLSFLGSCSIWHYPKADGVKQLIFLGIATGCMLLMQGINYQKIGRFAWGFYIVSLLLDLGIDARTARLRAQIIYLMLIGVYFAGDVGSERSQKALWAEVERLLRS